MTRRTAKRPAVRGRWEFSDTPYIQDGKADGYIRTIRSFLSAAGDHL